MWEVPLPSLKLVCHKGCWWELPSWSGPIRLKMCHSISIFDWRSGSASGIALTALCHRKSSKEACLDFASWEKRTQFQFMLCLFCSAGVFLLCWLLSPEQNRVPCLFQCCSWFFCKLCPFWKEKKLASTDLTYMTRWSCCVSPKYIFVSENFQFVWGTGLKLNKTGITLLP